MRLSRPTETQLRGLSPTGKASALSSKANKGTTAEELDGKYSETNFYDLFLLGQFYASEANRYDSGELIYEIKKLNYSIHQGTLLYVVDTNEEEEDEIPLYEWNAKA